MSVKTSTPLDVYKVFEEKGKVALIDVREVDEFEEVSTPLAVNLPLSSFDPEEVAANFPKDVDLYVVCKSGGRSLHAGKILESVGFKSVFNVAGGMMAWESLGLPVAQASDNV